MHAYTNYNAVAWFYDGLSKLVFGQNIKKAQTELLPFIPTDSKVLIAGGGTGWILEEIARLHKQGLEITYIDSSSKMIQRSKKRNCANNKIQFIELPVEDMKLPGGMYDVIITPFLADNFSDMAWKQVFAKLDRSLKPDGLWLYTDFEINNGSPLWQKWIIKLLYTFFRITCKLRNNKLPGTDACFVSYRRIHTKTFYAGFIVSGAYIKTK